MVTVFWNKQVKTDRTIPNSKPHVIIHGKGKGAHILIDFAVLGD
jgi:hypothetical protein